MSHLGGDTERGVIQTTGRVLFLDYQPAVNAYSIPRCPALHAHAHTHAGASARATATHARDALCRVRLVVIV